MGIACDALEASQIPTAACFVPAGQGLTHGALAAAARGCAWQALHHIRQVLGHPARQHSAQRGGITGGKELRGNQRGQRHGSPSLCRGNPSQVFSVKAQLRTQADNVDTFAADKMFAQGSMILFALSAAPAQAASSACTTYLRHQVRVSVQAAVRQVEHAVAAQACTDRSNLTSLAKHAHVQQQVWLA
jgi:hypothetical protein